MCRPRLRHFRVATSLESLRHRAPVRKHRSCWHCTGWHRIRASPSPQSNRRASPIQPSRRCSNASRSFPQTGVAYCLLAFPLSRSCACSLGHKHNVGASRGTALLIAHAPEAASTCFLNGNGSGGGAGTVNLAQPLQHKHHRISRTSSEIYAKLVVAVWALSALARVASAAAVPAGARPAAQEDG